MDFVFVFGVAFLFFVWLIAFLNDCYVPTKKAIGTVVNIVASFDKNRDSQRRYTHDVSHYALVEYRNGNDICIVARSVFPIREDFSIRKGDKVAVMYSDKHSDRVYIVRSKS